MRKFIRKITCESCGHFQGIVTNDGNGPQFDGCDAKLTVTCQMVHRLACYQPKVPIMKPKSQPSSNP